MLRTCIYAHELYKQSIADKSPRYDCKTLVEMFNSGEHYHTDNANKCYSIIND